MKQKVTARAPLRLSFAGGGTELSPFVDDRGGAVLNATIAMYAYCELGVSTDRVFYESLDLSLNESVDLDKIFDDQTFQLKLHHEIYKYVINHFNNDKPIPVENKNTLRCTNEAQDWEHHPTLTIAILQAFNDFLNLGLGDYELARHAFLVERVK